MSLHGEKCSSMGLGEGEEHNTLEWGQAKLLLLGFFGGGGGGGGGGCGVILR